MGTIPPTPSIAPRQSAPVLPLPQRLAACLRRHDMALPPPAPGVRYVRVPRLCIIIADDELRDAVDRRFHWPMIVLALLVLPLLAVELLYLDRAPEAERSWIGLLCWIGFTLVWFAFAIEFVLKIAIAECRVEYVRRNWLDVIILVVPLLRPLRLTSLLRTSRVFKLRGVGMKAFRYVLALVIGIEAAQPYLRKVGLRRASRGDRKPPHVMTRLELMTELQRLRDRSDAWDRWHAAEQEYLRAAGRAAFTDPAPGEHVAHPAPGEAGTSQATGATPAGHFAHSPAHGAAQPPAITAAQLAHTPAHTRPAS